MVNLPADPRRDFRFLPLITHQSHRFELYVPPWESLRRVLHFPGFLDISKSNSHSKCLPTFVCWTERNSCSPRTTAWSPHHRHCLSQEPPIGSPDVPPNIYSKLIEASRARSRLPSGTLGTLRSIVRLHLLLSEVYIGSPPAFPPTHSSLSAFT